MGASGNGVRKDYSNYGNIDIFADGSYQTAQTLTLPSDTGLETHARTVKLNGTSFAAPKVSGVIVKMLRLEPSLENRQILEIIQNTSDAVLGFEQGSMNRLNALSTISEKYAALRKARQALFVFLEVVCIMALVCVGLLIVIPIPEFLFRVLFPSRWMAIRMRKIDKIMAGDRKRPRDIRYIINCLFPGYSQLFESANKSLLEIGEPAVTQLIRLYPYKACNEFGDFTTCIYDLIDEIGGNCSSLFKILKRLWVFMPLVGIRKLRSFSWPNKKVKMMFVNEIPTRGMKTRNRFRILERLEQLKESKKKTNSCQV